MTATPNRLLSKRITSFFGSADHSGELSPKRAAASGGVQLEDLSMPPTKAQLERYVSRPLLQLPNTYKRDSHQRVFCNRNVDLDQVKFVGFDMDYTLCQYNDQLDSFTFDQIIQQLLKMGYPEQLATFKFNPKFAVRGLIFDTMYGNLVKCDAFGNVMVVRHGYTNYSPAEIEENYPASFINTKDIGTKRYYVMNTLFNVPETAVLADLVDLFDMLPDYTETPEGTGVVKGCTLITYDSIFKDVRAAVDQVHFSGTLKNEVANNLDKYVRKEPKLPLYLSLLRKHQRGIFLVTNSDYNYTRTIMSYLVDVPHLEGADKHESWADYFDLIVVSANKPAFFQDEGYVLREVDMATGALKLGEYTGTTAKGRVFAGGSVEHLNQMLGVRGGEVLYVGDHIFGDVLKSKKLRGWKTFLVLPELLHELEALKASVELHTRLKNLEFMLAEIYRDLDSTAVERPDLTNLNEAIEETSKKLDACFNPYFGSTFRSGSDQSFFAMQTARFADLYSHSFINLINYPVFYQFHAVLQQLPHERTMWREVVEVGHDDGKNAHGMLTL